MQQIKAIYDGQQVVLLEPVDLPPNTPLAVIVMDEAAVVAQVVARLAAQGLIRSTAPLANTLATFEPVRVEGPPVSQTLLDDRR